MSKLINKTTLVLVLAGLAGCASDSGRDRPTLPSYAVPLQGRVGWSVRCPLRTISNELDMRFEIFRNEDGSMKSYEQFCEENDSSSHIP